MSAELAILCLAAFAMVAVSVSGLIGAGLAGLDRLAAYVTPRHRARLWLALAALPLIAGALALMVSFLPAVGVGHDHCLAHDPHHPHLCPHHLGSAPGVVLVLIAGVLVTRAAQLLVTLSQGLRASRRTSETLAQASDRRGDVLVFPAADPQAFVLGAFRPRVHISRGLLMLDREVVDAVIAHERVHARRRDLLWRALAPALALGHVPAVARALRARLAAAQELAADVEAADALPGGRLTVAAALVALARRAHAPSPGISFTHGDLEVRVRALLAAPRPLSAWPTRLLLAAAALALVAVGVSHDLIHHGLETLLGALS